MEFRFVAQHYESKAWRQVRSQKACDLCRVKKRRCHHRQPPAANKPRNARKKSRIIEDDASTISHCDVVNISSSENGDQAAPLADIASENGTGDMMVSLQPDDNQSRPYQQNHHHYHHHYYHTVSLPPMEMSTPRFIGDLNPEARLLGEPISPEASEDMETGETGVWVQPQLLTPPEIGPGSSDGTSTYSGSPKMSAQARIVSDLVSEITIYALSNIFFANIHPTIPLLNEEEYRQGLLQGTIPMSLVHTVCLIAAKDIEARGFLKLLTSGESLVSIRNFCTALHTCIMTELTQRAAIQKLTLIRILGLLSLHHQGSDGAEQASSCLVQAVHHAQTMGLQLRQPQRKESHSDLKRLFWCLWTLDRLNAAIHSRPCCMADVDIDMDDLTPEESGSRAFDVWLRISKLLNKVIALYRPSSCGAMVEVESEFLGFEAIVDEMQGWDLPRPTLATLHVFYLATAILAHRLRTITALPSPTPARLRQQLSAIQVIRIMQDTERLEGLRPLPIVVYAPSLALSVSYQHLRYSRLLSDQEDARRDFQMGCSILQRLRKSWEAADPIAALAQSISVALERLPSLDMLHIKKQNVVNKDIRLQDPSLVVAETEASKRTIEMGLASHSSFEMLPEPQPLDLFGGMDDGFWMNPEVNNPVCFAGFPIMDDCRW